MKRGYQEGGMPQRTLFPDLPDEEYNQLIGSLGGNYEIDPELGARVDAYLANMPTLQQRLAAEDAALEAKMETGRIAHEQRMAEIEAELQASKEQRRREDALLAELRANPYQPTPPIVTPEESAAIDANILARQQQIEDSRAQQELAELEYLLKVQQGQQVDNAIEGLRMADSALPLAEGLAGLDPSEVPASTDSSGLVDPTSTNTAAQNRRLENAIKQQSNFDSNVLNRAISDINIADVADPGLMSPDEVERLDDDITAKYESQQQQLQELDKEALQIKSDTESLALAVKEFSQNTTAYADFRDQVNQVQQELAQFDEDTDSYVNRFANLEEDLQRQLNSLSNEATVASNPSAGTVNTEEEQLALAESFGIDRAALVEAQRQKILREGVVEPVLSSEMRHLLFTMELERAYAQKTLEAMGPIGEGRSEYPTYFKGEIKQTNTDFTTDRDNLLDLHLARRERLNAIEKPDFSNLADVQAYSELVRKEIINIDDVLALSQRARQAMQKSIYEGRVSYEDVLAALELRKIADRGVRREVTSEGFTYTVQGDVVGEGTVAGGLEPVDPTSPLYQTEGNVISSNLARGRTDFSRRSVGLGLGSSRKSRRFYNEEGIPFGHTNASAVDYVSDDDTSGSRLPDEQRTVGGGTTVINPDGVSREEYDAVMEALSRTPLGVFSTAGLNDFLRFAQLAPSDSAAGQLYAERTQKGFEGGTNRGLAAAQEAGMQMNAGGYASTGLMYYDNEADNLERYRQMSNAELDAELGRIRMESPANRGLLTNLIMSVLGERRAQERRDTVGPQQSTGLMGYDEGGYARLPYVNLDAYADRVLENERTRARNAEILANYNEYNQPIAMASTPEQRATAGSLVADFLPVVGGIKGFSDAAGVAADPNATLGQVATALGLASIGLLPGGRPATRAADAVRSRLDDVMDPTSDAGSAYLERQTNPTMAERIQNQQAADARGVGGDNFYLYPENYPGRLPSQSYGLRPSSRDTFPYSTNPSVNAPADNAPAPYFQGFSGEKPSLSAPTRAMPPAPDTLYLLREQMQYAGTERGAAARKAYDEYYDQVEASIQQSYNPARAYNEWLSQHLDALKTVPMEEAEYRRLVQDAYDIELFGQPVTNRPMSNAPRTTVTLNQDGVPIKVETSPVSTPTESPVLGGGLMENTEASRSSTPSISSLRGTMGDRERMNEELREAVAALEALDEPSSDIVDAVKDTTNMIQEADGLLARTPGGPSASSLGYGGFSINNLEDLTDQWSRANISESEYRRALQQMGVRIGGLKGNTDLDPSALIFQLPDGTKVRGIDNI